MRENDNMRTILLRHGPPHKLDYASYKTLCRVHTNEGNHIYIQTNQNDNEEPHWLYVGLFSEHDSVNCILSEADAKLPKRNKD